MDFTKAADRLAQEVDLAVVKNDPDDHRRHLGSSVIGEECEFKVWAGFRWLLLERFPARMKRLFQRGHDEELKFAALLRLAGWTVHDLDPNGEQFRFSAVDGHHGGGMDGYAYAPPSWGYDKPILLEWKTHNDKSFTDLKKNKVRKSKPRHFTQFQEYGAAWGLEWCLYGGINKDTDEIHWEFVRIEQQYGEETLRKAEHLVRTPTPPKKISTVATDYRCKMCHLAGICHFGDLPEKNCRSCVNASPGPDGSWVCSQFGVIPKDAIPHGCGNWFPITK